MSKMVTVNQAANKLGVSVDTVRRWNKKGLIKSHRNSHNYRLFSLAEIARMHKKISGEGGRNNYRILKTNKKVDIPV